MNEIELSANAALVLETVFDAPECGHGHGHGHGKPSTIRIMPGHCV